MTKSNSPLQRVLDHAIVAVIRAESGELLAEVVESFQLKRAVT